MTRLLLRRETGIDVFDIQVTPTERLLGSTFEAKAAIGGSTRQDVSPMNSDSD